MYRLWAPLVRQVDLTGAGWSAGANWAGTPPPEWPTSAGLGTGVYDEGFPDAASGFRVNRIRLFQDGNPGNDHTYAIFAPGGQPIGTVTPASAGWTAWLTVPAGIPDGQGIWTVEVDRAQGSSTAQPGLFPRPGNAGNQVDEPYVSPYGDRFEGILGVEFDGEPISDQPPQCRDEVTLQLSPPLPCARPGVPVAVQFTAAVNPVIPAYTGPYLWQITDVGSGMVLQPYTSGGPQQSFVFPGSGTYRVRVKVEQPECDESVLLDALQFAIPACVCDVALTGPTQIPCVSSGTAPAQTFTATTSSSYAGPFTWEVWPAAGPALVQTTGGSTYSFAFPGPGHYEVRVSLITAGCEIGTVSDAVSVTVPSCDCPLLNSLSVNTTSACDRVFVADVTFPPTAVAVTYEWDFGDGQSATTSVPSVAHTYQSNGTKHVSVTVVAPGCAPLSASVDTVVAGCQPVVPGGPPAPTGCSAGGGSVTVVFDQDLDPASASDPANYSVSIAGAPPITPGTVSYNAAARSVTISGLPISPGDSVNVTVSNVRSAAGQPLVSPTSVTCTAPATPTVPTTSPLCPILLVIAVVLLLLGSLAIVAGICFKVPWLVVVGGIVGGVGLILFILWAIFCAAITPCNVMQVVHCVLWVFVAIVGPVLATLANIFGGPVPSECGVAALVAWGGWGALFAWLGTIMSAVGCSRRC
ncbi:PKD domain-containing protein [Sphaerisporangium sp. B11E5]|uniref:PKD domain-containing protein n=1 Tax=Sphaerisporangium sp. B11E5 TaxID=3153563 RepID=UPI00325C5BAF